jgi:hypothetical protein
MNLNKLFNDKKVILLDDIYDILEDYIRKNLKIEIKYSPSIGFCDGKIKAILKLNGDIIDSDEHNIHKSLF